MDMNVKPRRLVTIVAVVVGSFLMSFGVAYAASADGSLYKFTTFHSSGVKLCGYDRASISTTSSSYAAWGWVSTRDGGCTAAEAHSRPAGYMGTSESAVNSSGTVCRSGGWQYTSYTTSGTWFGTGNGTNCHTVRSRAKGAQWDGDVDEYIVDDEVRYSPYLTW